MSRISVLFILLSMVIVNSGDTNHSNINNNNNHNKNNSINHSRSHSFHQPYGSTNSTKVVNHPISSVGAAANSKQESQLEQQQQQPQQQSQEQPPRDKRATGDFQLDEAEIARQNQITQQIFAKYLERRLFPHRSTNERIPTISEILPKPTSSTTARPRPRGFSSSEAFHSFRRGGTSKTSGRKRYGNNGQKQNQRRRGGSSSSGAHRQQLIDEAIAESEQDSEPTLQKPEYYADINAEADEVADDGQESLQSVESEQHDQYYSDVFNRDPSENEIDSDCPNCVDESQYTNKWTMPLLKLGEKRYYLGIFFKANWFKAAQYCRYHGMHLASISSQEENDRLEKHIRDFGLGHEHFWTSGTDLADEGIFFWMANGRPITFTNWNAGEPNNFRYENGEEENCLELWNRDGKGLKWNDSPCSFETFFVCEVQPN